MKRFHVHISVADIAQSARFYSALFGAPPTVEKPDYAKWMLEDPRVNFAISKRGAEPGINHLGFQTDSEAELDVMRLHHSAAELALDHEGATACCYAKSTKHWLADPQGIAWEMYHTMGEAQTYNGEDATAAPKEAATTCCAPASIVASPVSTKSAAEPALAASSCAV
jgi:catechol 2,3-dioxygenase-like lactoylglutathione lyase family enzyme